MVKVLSVFHMIGMRMVIMFYSFDGKHVGSGEDTNSDGYIDSEMIILENDDTLRLIDSNNNGILEMLN